MMLTGLPPRDHSKPSGEAEMGYLVEEGSVNDSICFGCAATKTLDIFDRTEVNFCPELLEPFCRILRTSKTNNARDLLREVPQQPLSR